MFLLTSALFILTSVQGQELVQYDYKSNSFNKNLPYGKPFTIQGNLVQNKDTIKAVGIKIFNTDAYQKWKLIKNALTSSQAEITRIENSASVDNAMLKSERKKHERLVKKEQDAKMKASLVHAAWWIKKSSIVEGKFSIPINTPLLMEESYSVEFSFYKSSKKEVDIPEMIQKGIDKSFTITKLKGAISHDDKVDQIISEVKSQLPDSIISGLDQGKIIFTKLDKDVILKELKQSLKKQIKKLGKYTNAIDASEKNIESTINYLKGNIINSMSSKDKAEVIKLLRDTSLRDNKYMPLFKVYSSKTSDKVKYEQKVKNIIIDYQEWLKNKKQFDLEKDNIQKDNKIIAEKFERTNAVSTTFVLSSSSTELIGTRIGTAYGVAVVDYKGLKDFDMIQYFGLKFHLGPYDKRLKDPYANDWSRFFVLTGIATTDNMKYRGQKLENTDIGVKPMLGLGADVLGKQISLTYGYVFFNQPKVNSSSLRGRHFISISFDFNVINYLIQKK